ncbi:hypothetical protein UREG_04452 [Uncinocarpus reesii 1704]|uniref:BZIP domain-containing protein n=1 Tax=Uncinocarpus reesii (strain UAMH 1704) TaxID=336963 RepID=C4JNY2_UNCRE|nr:uncharacterized protein UREG_04452 [Uncinocarpus reesii 1704]EEP79606.1 hypothetical protein UREG_04452 [Uncinocarpus reesii 1704]
MDHASHPPSHAHTPGSTPISPQNCEFDQTPGMQRNDDRRGTSPPMTGSIVGKKRKAPTTSRGVANLTPEQLAKKRANDREAQRAIRKRTKAQIEALERRVQELTSQQPYQDLQEALRQKQLAQAENEDIRRRLGSVMAILRPILASANSRSSTGPTGGNNGDAEESRPPLDPLGVWASHLDSAIPSPDPHSDTSSQRRDSLSHPPDHSVRTPASLESLTGGTTYDGSQRGLHSPSPSLSGTVQGYKHNWHPNPSYFHFNEQGLQSCNGFDFQKRNLVHGLEFSGSGERLGLNFLVDSSRQGLKIQEMSPQTTSPSYDVQPRYQQNFPVPPNNLFDTTLPPFGIPVRNAEPTCPLDCILLNFLRSRQREAAEGVSKGHLVGPPYPSVSSLLNPEKSANSHPLSKVFTDIISKFPDIRDLPEKVAVVYVMFLLMRWQIYPTRENYDRLPEWITPRTSQLVTPHPAWMDYLPWPRMRDRMIASYTDYDFNNWFIPYTTTLSINWPYADSDTLLAIPNSEEYVINPVFERHLRNLNNWSLGPAFAKHYPGLVDTCRIKTSPWDTATNGA